MNGSSSVFRLVLAALLFAAPALAQTQTQIQTPAGATPPARPPVVSAPPNAHAQKAKPAHGAKAAGTAPAREPPKPPEPAKAPAAEAPKEPAAEARKPEGGKPEPGKGSVTGMPLPRWASLRSDEVNLRSGPGTRYPIQWVYRRRDLPVQIEREFELWRAIEDQDGVKGWVHQATLTGRRGFVVKGGERVLRHAAAEDSAPVARLMPGVVGHIRACEAHAAWCEVQVGEYHGYLRRDELYGIYPGEAVN
jgi:SH3-like domain-containing protein